MPSFETSFSSHNDDDDFTSYSSDDQQQEEIQCLIQSQKHHHQQQQQQCCHYRPLPPPVLMIHEAAAKLQIAADEAIDRYFLQQQTEAQLDIVRDTNNADDNEYDDDDDDEGIITEQQRRQQQHRRKIIMNDHHHRAMYHKHHKWRQPFSTATAAAAAYYDSSMSGRNNSSGSGCSRKQRAGAATYRFPLLVSIQCIVVVALIITLLHKKADLYQQQQQQHHQPSNKEDNHKNDSGLMTQHVHGFNSSSDGKLEGIDVVSRGSTTTTVSPTQAAGNVVVVKGSSSSSSTGGGYQNLNEQQQQQQQQQQQHHHHYRDDDDHMANNLLLPIPLRVLEQYKRWHSVQNLEEEDPVAGNVHNRRKFVKASYSCPYQAGNHLHAFFNRFLYAILTNRTLLWSYISEDDCDDDDDNAAGKSADTNSSSSSSSSNDEKNCLLTDVETCNRILQRLDWIPSYDEWNERLHLDPPRVLRFPKGAHTASRISEGPLDDVRWDDDDDDDDDTNEDGNQHRDHFVLDLNPTDQVISFPRVHNIMFWWSDPDIRNTHLGTDWSRQVSRDLVTYGMEFLYGMLFQYTFRFSRELLTSVSLETKYDHDDDRNDNSNNNSNSSSLSSLQQQQQQHNKTTNNDDANQRYDDYSQEYTIALHSRHPTDSLDGCNITREQSCLRQLLRTKAAQDKNGACRVWIMTDRACTIAELRPWVDDVLHCAAEVAPHEQSAGKFAEHGPFAGAGYFQDLAVASAYARSAVVGTMRYDTRTGQGRYWRSSSNLLLELVQYRKTMEAWWSSRRNGTTTTDQKETVLSSDAVERCVMEIPPYKGKWESPDD